MAQSTVLSQQLLGTVEKGISVESSEQTKMEQSNRNAKVNDIVLLKDDSAPRSQWKMGRIIDVYLGQDGKVRSVRLLISDSTLDARGRRTTKPTYLERPIQKTVTLLEAN